MVSFKDIGSYGRLGNQLFQIATTLSLAERNKDVAKFKLWAYSKYFKNPIDQTLNESEIKFEYLESNFHYNEIPYKEGINIKGYFQSEKYFSIDIIRKYFEFNDLGLQLPDGCTCSIHVRRTDYLKFPDHHPVQSMSYYNAAMDIMRSNGVQKFLLFSDDMEWCKNNFKDVIFVESQNDIQDMCLMSMCHNNIITNSSFSWWASWLNTNESKKIIAPSRWFGSAMDGTITSDLYCSNWTVI